AGRIDRDPVAGVVAAAAEEAGVDERVPGRVHLRDEGVDAAGVVGLAERTRRVREAGGGRARAAGEVGVAGRIDRDPLADVQAGAAEEAGVDERVPGRVHLRDERVGAAGVVGLAERTRRVREAGAGRTRPAGDVGVAGRIDRDPVTDV